MKRMSEEHIHFIKTGGTIEFLASGYDAINKRLMKLDTTIDAYLQNLIQPHFGFTSETVFEKDSRDMTEEDRDAIVEAIQASPHKNIIVTHGTDTLTQTAEYLDGRLSEDDSFDKKVILIGSMIPIAGFAMSDAGFNLGFAIATFACIDSGVYICMNGDVFSPGEVQKNKTLLRFE
jgi:L-asparaginase